MAAERKSFIKVDELMPQVSVEQVAAFYGVPLPELHRVGKEIRSRCFLVCGRTCETGDRVLAIQADHPAKQWKCHQYECGKGGNLISLCDLLKPGENAGGRPRGDRFKAIAADLKAMVEGVLTSAGSPAAGAKSPEKKPNEPEPLPVNLPLAKSENERARALVNLDQKFIVDPANMPPAASAYFRRRPFLTPDFCRKWRMGYLPRDTGGDHAGGTMRGKIVYPWLSDAGEVLTWFGRDPEFEDKHRRWEAAGKVDREPEKFHFVKGFHRCIELFGQHAFQQDGVREKLQGLGLLLVEGPNDVIRLDTLGVPSVALCSNRISREQAAKAARLAREFASGIVTIFLDCDPEGEEGMKQCLMSLAQLCLVRLAWTSNMHGGKFKGRQPESLKPEEWTEIASVLATATRLVD
jgi:5S rRNA maturation endonuclease (ribonuclease M5)